MKTRVFHRYNIHVQPLSAYGKVKAILEALEPLKKMHDYGYIDEGEYVAIWWNTEEEV